MDRSWQWVEEAAANRQKREEEQEGRRGQKRDAEEPECIRKNEHSVSLKIIDVPLTQYIYACLRKRAKAVLNLLKYKNLET